MDDSQHQFGLSFCEKQIALWKRTYFKKTSKYPAKIKLRFYAPIADERTFKWFLEFVRNNKMESQTRITQDAYDALNAGLAMNDYGDNAYSTYAEFVPAPKNVQVMNGANATGV